MLHHVIASLVHFLSLADLSHVLSLGSAAPFLFATAPVAVPAGGSAGGDDDGGDDDGAGASEPTDFKAVGDAILAGMSEAERNRPFDAADEEEEDDDAGDDGAAAAATDEDDDAGESPYRDEEEGEEEDTDLEGRAAVDEAKEGADADEEQKDDEGDESELIKVTLPGLAERGEEDLDIEVDDPAIAERLRRLKNEGIRAREVGKRIAEVEDREAQLDAYREAIEHDPISFHLEQMTVDKQLEVARALILEHLDVLQPDIDKLIEDPKARLDAQRKQLNDLKASRTKLEESRAIKQHVKHCMRAVDKLIPEGVDRDTAQEFVRDARQQMAEAARRGERVSPETIPALLARRVKLYGFDKKPAPPAAPAPKGSKTPPAKPAAKAEPPKAKPVGEKAAKIAAGEKSKAPVSPQARVRRSQNARNAGSKVAPAGAGAAPVQLPAVPAEAEADVASMTKYLRGQKLPERWADGSE